MTQVVTASSFTFPGKGDFGDFQLHEPAVQLLQRLVCEPRADMTDIPPAVILAHREGQRSKERPGALWSREAGNNDFLTLRGLYLQPVVSTGTGQIFAVCALGHDPFEAFSLGFLKEFSAALLTVAAEFYQLVARQDGFEPLFTFEQREPAQIVAVSRVMVPTLPARAPPPVPPQQLQTLGFGIERAPEAAEMRLSGPMTGEQKLGEGLADLPLGTKAPETREGS